ncbi:nucleotide exchange factor GrpE [Betaproteobacteria bacterium]|nr:nucleotide exchange factor GrpE [Betaproteobacteria bacterium]
MTTKDKKDPYKEVAESLDIGEGDASPEFDSVSLNKGPVGSDSIAEADESGNKKISELTGLVEQEKDRNLRLQAEIENIRKRSVNDVSNARKYAIESFATNLLSVADSLETALNTEDQTFEQLEGGVNLTLKQLKQAFERANIEAVQPEIGEKFDPNWHQAVSSKPLDEIEEEVESGVIFEVLQKGYKISGRVIRPAVVVVTG